MTIDTNELRRLAQAATPGPWYVTGKLTRYVEARIDGGLLQEVAACGPTKADGGYGPQQEANARLIAAANPAAISELLDRLEAAEKERDDLAQRLEQSEQGRRKAIVERNVLRDRLALESQESGALHEAVERACEERDALRAELAQLHKEADKFGDGIDWIQRALQAEAKIEAMERQEPVAWMDRHGTLYNSVSHVRPSDKPLFTLSGAKGEWK